MNVYFLKCKYEDSYVFNIIGGLNHEKICDDNSNPIYNLIFSSILQKKR